MSSATGQTCTPGSVITVSNSYDTNAAANAATGAIYAKINSGLCETTPNTGYGASWPLVQAADAHATLPPVTSGVSATFGTVSAAGIDYLTVVDPVSSLACVAYHYGSNTAGNPAQAVSATWPIMGLDGGLSTSMSCV